MDPLIELLARLDTYIYALLVLVVWNFVWTQKMRHKVFGDGSDPTEDGLAVEVESLEERVRELEQK